MSASVNVSPGDYTHKRLVGPAFTVTEVATGAWWVVRPARFTTNTLSIKRGHNSPVPSQPQHSLSAGGNGADLHGSASTADTPEFRAIRISPSIRSIRLAGREIARAEVSETSIQVELEKATAANPPASDGGVNEDLAAVAFACWVVDGSRSPSRIRF